MTTLNVSQKELFNAICVVTAGCALLDQILWSEDGLDNDDIDIDSTLKWLVNRYPISPETAQQLEGWLVEQLGDPPNGDPTREQIISVINKLEELYDQMFCSGKPLKTYELYKYIDDEETLMYVGPVIETERHYCNGAVSNIQHLDNEVYWQMIGSRGYELAHGQIWRGSRSGEVVSYFNSGMEIDPITRVIR